MEFRQKLLKDLYREKILVYFKKKFIKIGSVVFELMGFKKCLFLCLLYRDVTERMREKEAF